MRIGLLQLNIKWESREENLATVERYLRVAKKENVDILFLPEMSFTGFSMNTEITGETDNKTQKEIMSLSEKYGIYIGAGWVKKQEKGYITDNKAGNHYSIAGDGEIKLDYVKIHPFSYSGEDRYFCGGDSISVCRIGEFNMGVAICYDLRFPYLFTKMSEEADFIIVPANWPQKRSEHWKCLLRARAIENQVYVAGVNCGGNVGEQYYSGDSVLINPDGDYCQEKKLRIEGRSMDEKLLIYDVENNVKEYREKFPVFADRKSLLFSL